MPSIAVCAVTILPANRATVGKSYVPKVLIELLAGGSFSPEISTTLSTVLDFQKAHGLDRTGVANDRMRYLLAE